MDTANRDRHERNLREALTTLVERCPVLAETVYWAGTSAVSMEELGHRQSLDLDFHTRSALMDVRPILARIRAAFGGDFELIQAPDEFGSGFRGVIRLSRGERVTIEVLSNYQDVPDDQLVASNVVAPLRRVSLTKYLSDKVQCIAERNEARDLVDVCAVLRRRPDLEQLARRRVAEQDGLLMAERLLRWTDAEILSDLKSYRDASLADAQWTRDTFMRWLKAEASGAEEKT
ncbi:MAG: nucleotidyl transferase AbiEii/AbiGii toxin family protein [Candidatus Sumerlaeota bacterium]|nr:nucleotidyl transferase AbiEii/AbiGii toxin family protein [Candidatus Sumerlaeota bacterium]